MSEGPQVAALRRLVARLRTRLDFVEGSTFWRARARWQRVRARVGITAPAEPAYPQREPVEALDAGDAYALFVVEHEMVAEELERLREAARGMADAPSIAIVVDDVACDVGQTTASLAAQVFPVEETILTSRVASSGTRAQRLNAALAICNADVIAFCDERHQLAPHATFEAVLGFLRGADVIAVYGDRDAVRDGVRCDPVFAPDWSPETLLSSFYCGELVFYRCDAVKAVGGFRAESEPALHYDLALRVLVPKARVEHRSHILVHEHVVSERGGLEARDVAPALTAAFGTRGEAVRVRTTACPHVWIPSVVERVENSVDVVIPTRDRSYILARCLDSVFTRNADVDVRVTLVDNGSREAATSALIASLSTRLPERFQILRMDEPFNFSKLINHGVAVGDAPFVLLLNNDAQFACDGGIGTMLEWARRPGIGAVGARLTYADGSLQHAGVVVGIGGLAGHVHRGMTGSEAERHPALCGVRNVSAVTGACLMVRRDVFEHSGGLDETLAIEYNDIDFCLRLRTAGLRNVYLPHVVLRHDESSSRRGFDGSPQVRRERERFRERWRTDAYRDPYHNRNLTLVDESAKLAI